jgi:DNA-binding XRE family transcriptional regulator
MAKAKHQRKRAEIDRHEDAGPARLPARPTSALPGSEEKVRVMEKRAMKREVLFHPHDEASPESRLLWEQAKNNAFVRVGSVQKKHTPQLAFSGRLKAMRARSGLSQLSLARKAGITQQAVALLESGKREPTLAVLVALADAFKVGIDELIGRKTPSR